MIRSNSYILFPGATYSVKAQLAIDNFLTTPTSGQQDTIATFVDANDAVGNWDKMKYFICGKGLVSLNKYRSWTEVRDAIKGDGSTAITYPVEETLGFGGDGAARYLNLNWNPVDDGDANTAIDRFGFGAKIEVVRNMVAGDYYKFMESDDVYASKIQYAYDANNVRIQVNQSAASALSSADRTTLGNISVESLRDSYPSGTQRVRGLIDGVVDVNTVEIPPNETSADFYGLARNYQGGVTDGYADGVVSVFYFYDPYQFNHTIFNSSLVTMLSNI